MSSEHAESESANPFPFNNLFFIKGYISGRNEFWLYVLGLVAAFLGYFCFQLIMMLPLMAAAQSHGIGMDKIIQNPAILFNPDAIGMNRSLMLALLMGMFVFTLLFFWGFTRLVQHKPLTSMLTGFDKFRWKRYFFAFSVWGALLLGFTLVSYLMAPEELELRFDASRFALLFVVAMVMVPIQTATEELLFRGYLMQGFALVFKNGLPGLLLTSVLFGLLHASNPEAQAHGLLIMMPYYMLFGAFLGVITLLDEGAELAMGIHFANNFFSALLICSKNSVLQTDAIFYTSTEEPLRELIAWAIMATVCFFIFYKTYKLSNWKLLIR